MSNRPAMIASTAREILAVALRECPPTCGIVSITRVEVSDDSGYVTVYISAFKNPELALASLDERVKPLRQRLRVLELRRLPILRFRLEPHTDVLGLPPMEM